MNVYVYYDVPLAERVALVTRVRSMQSELRDCAARIDLLRRPEAKADAQTWMEVYEDVASDFAARLAAAVAKHDLAAVTGPRHVEHFIAVE